MLPHLPWPLPAVLGWSSSWLLFLLLQRGGWTPLWALLAASLWGALISLWGDTLWRKLFIAGGFPLSLALTQAQAFPAWAWLLPLACLLLLYPLQSWKDAPLFPTPPDALNDLPGVAPVEPGAAVLDAGCGLGDGLMALSQAYPLAVLHGLEWSRPLRWLCARRCPWAHVERGDIWQADWGAYALVYLFQRPESMPRAWAKACAEMAPGTWLVSLEFAVPEATAHAHIALAGERRVWVYRMPGALAQGSGKRDRAS